MSPHDKAILDRIHDKHYGPDAKRPRSDRKAEKIEKVLKGRKAAKTSHQDAPGQEITTGVGIVNQAPHQDSVPDFSMRKGQQVNVLNTISNPSRKDLMQEAQQHGIKYFRILSKQELTDVLKNLGDQKYIDIVVGHAKTRWQSGWQKNKQVKAQPVLVV